MRQTMQRSTQRQAQSGMVPAVSRSRAVSAPHFIGNQAHLASLARLADFGAQAKLEIGEANDPMEREADATADRVMRMNDGPPDLSSGPLQVRRKCSTCDEKDDLLQRTPAGQGKTSVPAPPVSAILSGPSKALDPRARRFMETRFGRDFSGVRVHTDSAAGASAGHLNAKAYTVENDVVFGHGQYDPGSDAGRRLLAHELTHVVQQSAGLDDRRVVRREEEQPPPEARAPAAPQRQESKDVLSAVNEQNPEHDVSGTGNYEKAFLILNGCAMPAMLATLYELKSFGTFSLLQEHINQAKGVDAPRIQVAMAAVDAYGTVKIDAFKTAQGQALTSLPLCQQKDIENFFIDPKTAATMLQCDEEQLKKAQAVVPVPAADIAGWSPVQKLSRAIDWARIEGKDAIKEGLDNLMSKQTLFAIASTATLFLVAQYCPVTWIADAALLATIAIAFLFRVGLALTFLKDIGKFLYAVAATTDDALRDSGKALAEALVLVEFEIVLGVVAKGGKAAGGALKSAVAAGPPGSGLTDAYAPGVGMVRIPDTIIPKDAPEFPGKSMTTGGGAGAKPGAPGTVPEEPVQPTKAPAKPTQGLKLTGRVDGLRPNEVDLLQKARKFYNLPPAPTEAETAIVGVLITESAEPMNVKSGVDGGVYGGVPRGPGSGFDRYTSGHVEGNVAAIMRQRGIMRGVLLMEKYFCANCDRNFAQTLPKGSQVLVIFPDSAEVVTSSSM